MTPKLIEVKRVHQNIMVSSKNIADGKAEVWNRYGFTSTSAFDAYWELSCDGKVVNEGRLNLPAVAPLSRKVVDVHVPFVKPLEGAEYLYRISFRLKDDSLWAEKGYEIAASQLPFRSKTPLVKTETGNFADLPKVKISESGKKISVKGEKFKVVFSRRKGTLCRLEYGGKEIMACTPGACCGPKVNVFRAFTDNDKWMRKRFFESGLSQISYHARPLKVERLSDQAVRVVTDVDACGFKSARYKHVSEYLITGDGTISVKHNISPAGKQPVVPRMGVSMVLDKSLENLAYYGRGPWENYVDRKTGSDLGYYESTVTDQYYPYIKPQECGGKSDVRWAAFMDEDGDGVLFKATQPLFMSALHYTAEDLDRARHRKGQERIYNIPAPRDEVYLSLDAAQMGLGGASCGPPPMQKYRIKAEAVSFSYMMCPCKAGWVSLSRSARRKALLPHAVEIKRDNEGIVSITGCGEIRYTTDGSEPGRDSKLYSSPYRQVDAADVKAVAFSPAGGRSVVTSVSYTKLTGLVKRSGDRLKIIGCDSEQNPGEGPAVNAVDGNRSTFWHSRWDPSPEKYPHFITVDVGSKEKIGGITMLGRTDGNVNGDIKKYRVFVSQDGENWGKPVAEGEFQQPTSSEQKVEFNTIEGRYVKFEALSEAKGQPFAAVAELGVLIAL